MERITQDFLDNQLKRINENLHAVEGNRFVFYIAYGKIRLCQEVYGSTGIRDISCAVTKREMYNILETLENLLWRVKDIKLK